MSENLRLRGLYAITSSALCADPDRLAAAADAALRGGATVLQYRDKTSAPAQRLANARLLRGLCDRRGARLIINDDMALAQAAGADGVHLGAGDGSIAAARSALGAAAIIGASCGPSLARAQAALAAGASYVAFGRFFDSRTKPDAPQATLELLAEARPLLWPAAICAIGGVTTDNGAALVACGADLIAAVDGVFGHDDPQQIEAAARAYRALFAC
ncbi:MAG: thiamine phosphate synthase [Nevskia sp.]